MLSRRYALAAVTLQDCIFAVGGVDGDRCLNTTERFDPREGRQAPAAVFSFCISAYR